MPKFARFLGLLVFLCASLCSLYLFLPIQKRQASWTFYIQPKSTLSHAMQVDQWQENISFPRLFGWVVNALGQAKDVKSGAYAITAQTTPYALIKQLVNEDVITHQLTLVEGTSWQAFKVAIDALPRYHVTPLSETQLIKVLNCPYKSVEGLFFPTTYQWHWLTDDVALYRQGYRLMQERLQQVWNERDAGLPYQKPYELLIVASLIEREAKIDKERPLIARVIVNRLQKGMRLQIDASVLYGLGRTSGRVHHRDLKKKSPYNTYLNKGLPPTPIALPSEASLQAASHPASGDVWYYVLCSDTGHHCFSKTWNQHQQAILKAKRRMSRK